MPDHEARPRGAAEDAETLTAAREALRPFAVQPISRFLLNVQRKPAELEAAFWRLVYEGAPYEIPHATVVELVAELEACPRPLEDLLEGRLAPRAFS